MKRILHIEDELDITTAYKMYFEYLLNTPHIYEYNVRADNLLPLLKRAREENFQYAVVILDNNTPGQLRGLEALAQAREHGFDMPIIVHSAYLKQEEMDTVIKKRKAKFIPKPEFQEVARHVKEILEN